MNDNGFDVNGVVDELSIKQQLLEIMMPDLRFFAEKDISNPPPVTRLPVQLAKLLEAYPFGGVILFRENLRSLDEIIQLTDDLQKNSVFGRFIAVDQEGGTVTRIYNAVEMPGNMALGAIDDTAITSQSIGILAAELRALGFNFAFSPVLDVNSNPNNPIVGVRSFGSDPELVARHGRAYIEGLNSQDVIPCAKHFPGHGDTETDSHYSAPLISRSLADFEKVDFVPFKAAIDNQVDTIMTAHIIAPALDDQQVYSSKEKKLVATPATLSKPILTGLLRGKLGFQGVIVSDALDMQGITQHFDAVESTILCLKAGVDLLLMPIRVWSEEGIARFVAYFDEVVNICSQDAELQKNVKESCKRLLVLKSKKVTPQLRAQTDLATRKAAMNEFILNARHREFQEKTAAAAITLARNAKSLLPWVSAQTDSILIVTDNEVISAEAQERLHQLGFLNTSVLPFTGITSPAPELKSADKVLLLTCNLTAADARINSLVDQLNQSNKAYVQLSCHNPYDVMNVQGVATNVLVYGASGVDQTNYSLRKFPLNLDQAIIKIFNAKNESEFNKHCPVDLAI